MYLLLIFSSIGSLGLWIINLVFPIINTIDPILLLIISMLSVIIFFYGISVLTLVNEKIYVSEDSITCKSSKRIKTRIKWKEITDISEHHLLRRTDINTEDLCITVDHHISNYKDFKQLLNNYLSSDVPINYAII
jgi:hypothetical protein